MKAEVKWDSGPGFAEVMEALDLPATDHIVAVHDDEGKLLALYTPVHAEEPGDSILWSAVLLRDRDGILRVEGTRPLGRMREVIRAQSGIDPFEGLDADGPAG